MNWDYDFSFFFDPCLLYFWVQSQTNSMGLTTQIKGLILRSSCCFFFLFLQKPQGSPFIVFRVLSSLKITQKANNWFSCCLFPIRIQMSASTQYLLLPTKMYKHKCLSLTNARCPLCCFSLTCCLGMILRQWQRKIIVRARNQTKPKVPTKLCEDLNHRTDVWAQNSPRAFLEVIPMSH